MPGVMRTMVQSPSNESVPSNDYRPRFGGKLDSMNSAGSSAGSGPPKSGPNDLSGSGMNGSNRPPCPDARVYCPDLRELDNRHKFSSARALFEQLEKETKVEKKFPPLPVIASPVMRQRRLAAQVPPHLQTNNSVQQTVSANRNNQTFMMPTVSNCNSGIDTGNSNSSATCHTSTRPSVPGMINSTGRSISNGGFNGSTSKSATNSSNSTAAMCAHPDLQFLAGKSSTTTSARNINTTSVGSSVTTSLSKLHSSTGSGTTKPDVFSSTTASATANNSMRSSGGGNASAPITSSSSSSGTRSAQPRRSSSTSPQDDAEDAIDAFERTLRASHDFLTALSAGSQNSIPIPSTRPSRSTASSSHVLLGSSNNSSVKTGSHHQPPPVPPKPRVGGGSVVTGNQFNSSPSPYKPRSPSLDSSSKTSQSFASHNGIAATTPSTTDHLSFPSSQPSWAKDFCRSKAVGPVTTNGAHNANSSQETNVLSDDDLYQASKELNELVEQIEKMHHDASDGSRGTRFEGSSAVASKSDSARTPKSLSNAVSSALGVLKSVEQVSGPYAPAKPSIYEPYWRQPWYRSRDPKYNSHQSSADSGLPASPQSSQGTTAGDVPPAINGESMTTIPPLSSSPPNATYHTVAAQKISDHVEPFSNQTTYEVAHRQPLLPDVRHIPVKVNGATGNDRIQENESANSSPEPVSGCPSSPAAVVTGSGRPPWATPTRSPLHEQLHGGVLVTQLNTKHSTEVPAVRSSRVSPLKSKLPDLPVEPVVLAPATKSSPTKQNTTSPTTTESPLVARWRERVAAQHIESTTAPNVVADEPVEKPTDKPTTVISSSEVSRMRRTGAEIPTSEHVSSCLASVDIGASSSGSLASSPHTVSTTAPVSVTSPVVLPATIPDVVSNTTVIPAIAPSATPASLLPNKIISPSLAGRPPPSPAKTAKHEIPIVKAAARSSATERDVVEPMTSEEAAMLLSPRTRQDILDDEQFGREIRTLHSSFHPPHDDYNKRLSTCSIDSAAERERALSRTSTVTDKDDEPMTPTKEDVTPTSDAASAQAPPFQIQYIEDDKFYIEIEGLEYEEQTELTTPNGTKISVKKASRIRFSNAPIKVYSTHSVNDYDRRNDDVDPVAASAEFELERRVEKMDKFSVELSKGDDGLGLSIIGMGVGADAGLEKLGIFVKSITPHGSADRDGRIKVCDQIIEVDGCNLLGVTQAYAAQVLRSTNGIVRFLIGREKDVESSEIAMLIRQSLEQDRMREEHNRKMQYMMAQNGGDMFGQPRDRMPAISRPADWGTGANRSQLPSTDSVFDPDSIGDLTPDAFETGGDGLNELMQQMRTHESATTTDADRGPGAPNNEDDSSPSTETSISTVSSRSIEDDLAAFPSQHGAFHVSSELDSFRSTEDVPEPSPETSQLLSESLQEFPVKPSPRRPMYHQPDSSASVGLPVGASSPQVSPPKSASISSSSSKRKSSSQEDQAMRSALEDFRRENEKHQALLLESREHCDELEHRYVKARRTIKDYESREKDGFVRQETQILALRQRELELQLIIARLQEKITEYEHQINEAGMTDSAPSPIPDDTTSHSRNTTTTSPSTLSSPTPTSPLDRSPSSEVAQKFVDNSTTSCDSPAPSSSDGGSTPASTAPQPKARSKKPTPADLGVPETEMLDSKVAKSKVDAVRNSQIMSGRGLPTKATNPSDHEIEIMCHHQHHNEDRNISAMSSHSAYPTIDSSGNTVTSSAIPDTSSASISSGSIEVTSRSETATSSSAASLPNSTKPVKAPRSSVFASSPLMLRKLSGGLFRSSKKQYQPMQSPTITELPTAAAGSVQTMSAEPNTTNTGSRVGEDDKDVEKRMKVLTELDLTPSQILDWTIADIKTYLEYLGLEKYYPEFTINQVDGQKFLTLDGSQLKSIGVQNHTDRTILKKKIKELKASVEREKKLAEKEAKRIAKERKMIVRR